jgi:hypothetical protein
MDLMPWQRRREEPLQGYVAAQPIELQRASQLNVQRTIGCPPSGPQRLHQDRSQPAVSGKHRSALTRESSLKPSATTALSTPTPSTLPVLSYWRDLEIFNIPAAPSDRDNSDLVKVVTMRPGDDLTWHRAQFQPTEQHSYIHVVHVPRSSASRCAACDLCRSSSRRSCSACHSMRLTARLCWLCQAPRVRIVVAPIEPRTRGRR